MTCSFFVPFFFCFCLCRIENIVCNFQECNLNIQFKLVIDLPLGGPLGNGGGGLGALSKLPCPIGGGALWGMKGGGPRLPSPPPCWSLGPPNGGGNGGGGLEFMF